MHTGLNGDLYLTLNNHLAVVQTLVWQDSKAEALAGWQSPPQSKQTFGIRRRPVIDLFLLGIFGLSWGP